jgi:hypothetical protein
MKSPPGESAAIVRFIARHRASKNSTGASPDGRSIPSSPVVAVIL